MKSFGGLYCSGIGLTGYLQENFSAYEDKILLCSHIGDPRYAFLVLFPLTYCLDKYLGLKVLWTSAITEWLNAVLKWCVRDERPYWWQSTDCSYSSKALKQFKITCESGPGFPSGHVMSTSSLGFLLLVYLTSCLRSKNGKMVVGGVIAGVHVALMILVSLSRIYIATHFPHQVVVGSILGIFTAFSVHIATLKNSTQKLFSGYAIPVGLSLLVSALSLYNALLLLNLDPTSSVELALKYCHYRSWVHLDTTLFFAVVRDAASLCGIGVGSFLFTFCMSEDKSYLFTHRNISATSWVSSGILGSSLSYIFLYMESFKISEESVISFYILAFYKYLAIPCFVILIEYICRTMCEIFFKKKVKI